MVSIDKHHNCKYFGFQTFQRGLLIRLLNLFEINSSMLFHSSLTIWQSAIGVPLFIHEIWFTFILFVYICVFFYFKNELNTWISWIFKKKVYVCIYCLTEKFMVFMEKLDKLSYDYSSKRRIRTKTNLYLLNLLLRYL